MAEVRQLVLEKGRFEKSVLYRVKKGWRIIFTLGPEFLADSNTLVMINYPAADGVFDRNKYVNLSRHDDEETELIVSKPGSYHYYVTVNDDSTPVCDGYINVDPELPHNLTLDSLGW